MLALSKIDQKSYNDKYNVIKEKKVQLNFKKTKAIIIDQFSVSDTDADKILNKVFAIQKETQLNRDGFFLVLKYVQCMQNGIDIDKCDIYATVLAQKLTVVKKQKVQPQQPEEHLNKSMAHLNQLQSLIKEDLNKVSQIIQQVDSPSKDSSSGNNGLVGSQSDNPKKTNSLTNQEISVHVTQEFQDIYKDCEITQEIQNSDNTNELVDVDIDQTQSQVKVDGNQKQKQDLEQEQEVKNNQEKQQQQQVKQVEQAIQQVKEGKQAVSETKQAVSETKQQYLEQQKANNSNEISEVNMQGSQNQKPIQIDKLDEQLPEINVDEQRNYPDIIEISDDSPKYGKADISPTSEKQFSVAVGPFDYIREHKVSKGYYQCLVNTKLIQIENGGEIKSQIQVLRRYKDFEMLQEYFLNAYMGKIIPKLPEKDSLIGNIRKMIREPTEKLEERRAGLEYFLKYLCDNFKQDEKLLIFLSNEQRFTDVLKQLREDVEFNDDDTLPNPEDYTFQAKAFGIAKMVKESSMQDYSNLIFSYFSQNKQVEGQFQQEYKWVQQNYELLQSKYKDILEFESQFNKFYEPIAQFSFNSKQELAIIVELQNREIMLEVQKNYKDLEYRKLNHVILMIKEMKESLENVFFSYEQVVKHISKWSASKLKLLQEQDKTKMYNLIYIHRNSQILKNEKEEEQLKRIISELNDSLTKISTKYSMDLNSLLDQLMIQIISI